MGGGGRTAAKATSPDPEPATPALYLHTAAHGASMRVGVCGLFSVCAMYYHIAVQGDVSKSWHGCVCVCVCVCRVLKTKERG